MPRVAPLACQAEQTKTHASRRTCVRDAGEGFDNVMKVVLDKSALVGASEQVLRQFASGRSYILTPTLRYEIATGARRTALKCERTLRKLRGMLGSRGWPVGPGRQAAVEF